MGWCWWPACPPRTRVMSELLPRAMSRSIGQQQPVTELMSVAPVTNEARWFFVCIVLFLIVMFGEFLYSGCLRGEYGGTGR